MSLLKQMQMTKKPLFDIFIYDTESSNNPHHNSSGKRHLFTSPFKLNDYYKASLTVEASVVLPVLIYAVVFVMINFRILAIGWGISAGATDVARAVAVYSALDKERDEIYSLVGGVTLVGSTIASIEKNEIPAKFINNGSLGISYLGSSLTEQDVDIKINYAVDIPINFFGRKMYFITQRARAKRWIGYDPKEGVTEEEYVYVTKNGVAYHRNIKCPYLNPSVKMVDKDSVTDIRSEGGGKYYPCDVCKNASSNDVYYVTDYGDVYHNSITCKSLIRYIERVSINKLSGQHPCPKCG